jgi:hypothetical protein
MKTYQKGTGKISLEKATIYVHVKAPALNPTHHDGDRQSKKLLQSAAI